MALGYDQCKEAANFISSKIKTPPKLAIVCGSGLGGLADQITEGVSIPFGDIPHFPQTTVHGHAGRLVVGNLSGVVTVCQVGRLHPYEGHTLDKVVFPVRVMSLLGVKVVIVTNAAGGLNQSFTPGDLMLIQDHISIPGLAGNNPLVGRNDERFGVRFPAMSDAYDPELRRIATEAGAAEGVRFHSGVYCMVSGPTYETRAESRFLRLIGADAVGMSTAPEVAAARHAGVRVLGISLITNKVVMDDSDTSRANHEEVLECAAQSASKLQRVVARIVQSTGLQEAGSAERTARCRGGRDSPSAVTP